MHGRVKGSMRSLDVGTDCWNLKPATLDEIRHRLKTLPTNPDLSDAYFKTQSSKDERR